MIIIMILLSIISAFLAFIIVYAVIKKEFPKIYLLFSVYIELCIIVAVYFENVGYFGLLGILGIVLPIITKIKKNKK